MEQKNQQQRLEKIASGFGIPNACRWYREPPGHDLSNIAGMEDLKRRLMDLASFAGWTELDEILGISPFSSYIFYGLPGTGRTYLIEAFAAELMKKGFKFVRLTGDDIYRSLVGVAEKFVQIAFQEAADNAPCLIFIDDIENVCVNRSDPRTSSYQMRRTIDFLEAYYELKNSGKPVIFVGATDHPEWVDEALLDWSQLVKVPLPDRSARKAFFQKAFRMLVLEPGFTVEDMAAATDQYNYYDLRRLELEVIAWVNMRAIREFTILDAEGNMDQAATDARISEALKNREIPLDKALFDKAREEKPPADKTEALARLEAFERWPK